MSHLYCPECGFQNPESANYCSKCGTLLVKDEVGSETTMTYMPDEADEEGALALEDFRTDGPALVVRSGGGRAGGTQGGSRLSGERDAERLRTILRLQRDESLPLRVIKQELSSPSGKERSKRPQPLGMAGAEDELDVEDLCERAGITRELARELEEFGLLEPRLEGGAKRYTETDADIALACGKLSR